MKRWLSILLLCAAAALHAETRDDMINTRNELRLGWGDQLFETLMWHNPLNVAITMPETYTAIYHEDYRYRQHLWLEYQWRLYYWLSLGLMTDFSEVGWSDVIRNGKGVELQRSNGKYFYNVVFMPTVRFIYFHHPNVNIYSGLGIGMDINGGTELNADGVDTQLGLALNITAVGFSFNYQRWFMAFDFGGLTALQSKDVVFLAASRICNISIGARF